MLHKILNFINRFFWKIAAEHPALTKLKQESIKPFENLSPCFNDDEINQSFKKDNEKWFHHEYIYKIINIRIEPSFKSCVYCLRTIIKETQTRDEDLPSVFKLLVYRYLFRKETNLKEAVYFDGHNGRNYFHFFSDVINKIWILIDLGVDKSVPFIISFETFNSTYFRYLFCNTFLNEYNWIVQDMKTWVKVKELWYVRPFPYKIEYWNKTYDLLKIKNTQTYNKVFINRAPNTGRYLVNFKEIEPLLLKNNFIIVDTTLWSFEEEVKFFSQVDILIGIHGAGNTNMFFCNKERLKFIELLPANRISCQFYWLSLMFNISYNVLKGTNLDESGGFLVSPVLLEQMLLKILS